MADNPYTQFVTPEAPQQPSDAANPYPQMIAAPNAVPPQSPAPPSRPFNVLPLNEDAQGHIHFDITAGLPGAILRAVSAPADVYEGRLDPMSPEGNARAREFAMTFSPMSPAMRVGARTLSSDLLSERRGKPAIPTADQLKATANSQYDAARATGAEYPGSSIGDMAANVQSGLQNDGILAELAPKTHSILQQLQGGPPGSVVTIASLDAARKALNRIGGTFGNPTEQEAARRAIRELDSFIANGGNSSSGAAMGAGGSSAALSEPPAAAGAADAIGMAGSATGDQDPLAQAARLIQQARGNAAAAFRSGRITDAEDAADLRAAATNSGQNGGNATRQRLASLLNSNKQSRGFSEDELDAMRQIVKGTLASNSLRRTSNMLGGGGGLGHSLVTMLGGIGGSMVGGEVGAGVGAGLAAGTGAATRSAYNALVGRQIAKLDELVRRRSPLYQQSAGPMLPNLWDRALGFGAQGGLLGLNNGGGLLDNYSFGNGS